MSSGALSPERFVWLDWPDGSVVFDRLLGDTHTLDAINAVVLRALMQDDAPDGQALQAELARLQPGASAAQLRDTLAQVRADLAQHGLIPHG